MQFSQYLRSTLSSTATVLILVVLVATLLTAHEDSNFLDAIPFAPARGRLVAADVAIGDIPLETLVPSAILQLSPQDALARNLALPVSHASNPRAPRFVATWLGSDFERSTICLANAVYYEANGEPMVGQRAVAQVVLNRLRHPRFPKSICDVVYQGAERPTGCQFSFTCDGASARVPNPVRYKVALGVAITALEGWTSAEAGQATHYHTLYVFPKWAPELLKTGIVGHHIFYRLPGRFYDYSTYRAATATQLTDAPELPPLTQSKTASRETAGDNGPRPGDIAHAAVPNLIIPRGDASSYTGEAPGAVPPIATPTPAASPTPAPSPKSYFPDRRSSRSHLPLAQ